jgi:hypothetical protein
MKISLWRGYHEEMLPQWISQAWRSNSLLILCPPLLRDFGFIEQLPGDELELLGEWDALTRLKVQGILP